MSTAPCVPTNVTAVRNCQQSSVMLSWAASQGARNYTATALSNSGHRVDCISNNTTCNMVGLRCSQNYSVGVTAVGDSCSSLSSQAVTVLAAPCSPVRVTGSLECLSNAVSLTWDVSPNSLSYNVLAIGRAGDRVNCNNTAPSCQLSGLLCGQNYNFTVSASDTSCQSPNSTPFILPTAPCTPTNVQNRLDCGTNNLTVSWDPNPDPLNYNVGVRSADGIVQTCTSLYTSCSVTSLTCGQDYAFTVTATNNYCRSPPSVTRTIRTVPCVPQLVQGNVDCASNTLLVSWISIRVARTYAARILGSNGYSNSCTTADLSCSFSQLQCSQQYNISVLALDSQCNSTSSPAISVSTAPCPPVIVNSTLNCTTNVASLSWVTGNAVVDVVVNASSSQGHQTWCRSTNGTCDLVDLRCGQNYTVRASVAGASCGSAASPASYILTAPCAPQNVTRNLDCMTNSVWVTWGRATGAQTYVVTALGTRGDNATCSTSNTTCTVPSLRCSALYTFYVTGSNLQCRSPASSTFNIQTAPCQPTAISADLSCANSTAYVTWAPVAAAVQYQACAQSTDNNPLCCQTTNTFCTVVGLQCGSTYNFSVQASNQVCRSSFSQPYSKGAVPCPPSELWTRLYPMQNGMQVLRVSWSVIVCCEVEYLAETSSSQQGNEDTSSVMRSYWTNGRVFEFPLSCNSRYTVTVQSRNLAGTSTPSTAVNGTTAPCPPLGITYSIKNGSAMLSWKASVLATEYAVYELKGAALLLVCNTVQLQCNVTGANRSAIEMTAINAAGQSNPSTNIQDITQYRIRRGLKGTNSFYEDETDVSIPVLKIGNVTSNSLYAEWNSVEGATSYSLVVRQQSSKQHSVELSVYGFNSTVTDLKPATRYCISVYAKKSISTSPYSTPICVKTGVQI
uniref:Fibronectin type III domain-containing protein 7-like n=1 Tax=Paramormyrops kingsleyae TaxID=1676925 RepID=A0A3B3TCY5_9TELE